MGMMLPPQLTDMAQGQGDGLPELQDAIHPVTAAMHAVPDSGDTKELTKALVILAGVQHRLMGPAGGSQQTG